MHTSLALLPVLAAAVFAQGTPVAETQGPTSTAAQGNSCNACFIQANIAQVIFADFTSTATASAVVSATTGRNGTVVTTTLVQPAQAFSFGPTGLLSGTPVSGAYVPLTGSTIVLGGATLTSPIAYNVISAYTSFTEVLVGGSCVATPVTTQTVSPASSYTITQGQPAAAVTDAENSFRIAIGGETCSVSAGPVSTTIPVSMTTTTTTSTATSLGRPSSLPDSTTGAAATSSASAAATSSGSVGTTSSFVIITPTAIITGAAAVFRPLALPAGVSSGLIATLLALPGIAAWLL